MIVPDNVPTMTPTPGRSHLASSRFHIDRIKQFTTARIVSRVYINIPTYIGRYTSLQDTSSTHRTYIRYISNAIHGYICEKIHLR